MYSLIILTYMCCFNLILLPIEEIKVFVSLRLKCHIFIGFNMAHYTFLCPAGENLYSAILMAFCILISQFILLLQKLSSFQYIGVVALSNDITLFTLLQELNGSVEICVNLCKLNKIKLNSNKTFEVNKDC